MRLTFSALPRAEACPASTFLPRVEETSIWAEQGRVIHAYLCDCATIGPIAAFDKVPEKFKPAAQVLDLERLPHNDPNAYAFEVAFAYDFERDTAREIGRNLNRDYSSATAAELCGTADVIGTTSDFVIALDVKSGYAALGEPKTALQLLAQAVSACRAYGKTKAIVGWIRLRDGVPYYEQATLDMFELDAAAARIRDIVDACLAEELITAGQMDQVVPRPSEHCKYCPAARRCPANAELVRPFLLPEGATPAPLQLDEATAPMVYERATRVQAVLNMVFAALDVYAEGHPFTFANGDRYGKVGSTREKIDPLMAKAAFAPPAVVEGGPPIEISPPPLAPEVWSQVWDEATKIEHKLTKADLERALRRHKPPGVKITHLERDVLKRLRATKAAYSETYYSVKRFTPKKDPRLQGTEPVTLEETY